jgi:four helix bundle protein
LEISYENFKSNYKDYRLDKDFQSLDAWKKCRKVKLYFCNKILSKLPAEEKFNLNIQIRKTSISITANIAEGYGRYHFKEGIRFYRISRASLYELKDHLISCVDLNYINDEEFVIALNLIESAKTTLNGFIKFVGNKIKSEKTSK